MAAAKGSNVTEHPAAKTGGTPIPPGADPDAALNNSEVRGAVLSTFERVRGLEAERNDTNSDIRACWEGLKGRGLNIRALKAQYAYWKMDDTDKASFDQALAIAREAIGRPVQIDLVDDGAGEGDGHPTSH